MLHPVWYSDAIHENILFCKPQPNNSINESLLKMFVQATEPFKFDWKKCVSICSDGAMALTRKKSGLIARLKSFILNASWVHCFLHRLALAAKKMPDELQQVLNEAVKIVN